MLSRFKLEIYYITDKFIYIWQGYAQTKRNKKGKWFKYIKGKACRMWWKQMECPRNHNIQISFPEINSALHMKENIYTIK